MFTKEQVALRSNWEARIQKSGFNPAKWNEGQMIVLGKLPTSISQAISESLPKVVDKINAFFADADPELCPEYPGITRSEVYKAVAQSWAHQDFSLTVRMDFAVTKSGNLHLLAIKGDNLDTTVGVARSAKAWYDHYYEGDITHVSINHLAEHVAAILAPYGSKASPPSFKDISVLSTSQSSAAYLADAVTKSSDLSLSKVGVAGLEALGDIEHDENIGSAVIKVDPWSKVLENAEEGSLWIEAFKTPRSFIMQPPWVLLLDEVLDFKEPVDEADIEFVLNIWMSDPGSSNASPLVVASEYFPGYSFEEAMVMPFVMNTADFPAQAEALQKAQEEELAEMAKTIKENFGRDVEDAEE